MTPLQDNQWYATVRPSISVGQEAIPRVLMPGITALGLLILYITLLHRCLSHLFTPNPTASKSDRVVFTKQDPLCDVEMSRLLCLRCGPITAVMLSVICYVCVGVWWPGDMIAARCGLRRRWTDLDFRLKSPIWSEKETKYASPPRLLSADGSP